MSEIWRKSAAEVAHAVRSGEFSAVDAARAALSRLEQVNPRVNAVVDFNAEEVMAQARAIDARRASGQELGILAGVPVTIKVNVDQIGFATTNGVKSQKTLIAQTNSPVVDNFLRADAVVIGRTNTPAFSYRWFTNNGIHGETLNPRNPAVTPGGSSGGAAAATAAGIGHIGHGTDIAGSIRYPAYACGVHGLRPTLGRVPAYNATGPERSIGGQLMAVSGPIARTVQDLRLGLWAMAAADHRDPWWVPVPLTLPLPPRKAAVCLYPDGMETAPAIVAALKESAAKLKEAGWEIVELEAVPPMKAIVDSQIALWMGDGYEGMVQSAQLDGDIGAITALAGQERIGRDITLESFSSALKTRATVTRQWQLFFEEHPVLLMPVSAELPFDTHLDLAGEAHYRRVWEAQTPMIALPFPGLPGLTFTTGMAGDRPVGIQVVAGRYREDLCLLAAEDIERRTDALPLAMS